MRPPRLGGREWVASGRYADNDVGMGMDISWSHSRSEEMPTPLGILSKNVRSSLAQVLKMMSRQENKWFLLGRESRNYVAT